MVLTRPRSRMMRLTQLAPDIVADVLAGRRNGLTLDALMRRGVPRDWLEQREMMVSAPRHSFRFLNVFRPFALSCEPVEQSKGERKVSTICPSTVRQAHSSGRTGSVGKLFSIISLALVQ